MLLARVLEEKLASLYRGGLIKGGVFLGRGQEALSVSVGVNLRKGDIFAPLIRDQAGRTGFRRLGGGHVSHLFGLAAWVDARPRWQHSSRTSPRGLLRDDQSSGGNDSGCSGRFDGAPFSRGDRRRRSDMPWRWWHLYRRIS